MGAFVWKDKFSVHVDAMDNHHKKLLAYLTELDDEIESLDASRKIGETLDGLTAYAAYHFIEEERLMTVLGHPGLESQRIQHAYFSNEVNEMIRQYAIGILPSRSVLAFLRDWFVNHILTEDFKYGELIRLNISKS